MEQEADAFGWPQCEGYLTVRPLEIQENCKVWMVQRESDQQYRVIKLISNQEAVASLHQAARAEGAEHLIEFYGVVSTDAGPALLAEYCPGGSLAQMVAARGPLPMGETITGLAPIAQTVAALHRQGLEHGDISPNNILLTADGMPKLTDFQETRLLVDSVNLAGTPGFISPEKCAGNISAALEGADVYALGACLWFLLSGKAPEPPHLRSPVDLVLPTVPDQILDLLVDSLQVDSEQRPSAEQFARTLFSSGQAEPLNWTSSVPGFATHLMSTIHPANPVRKQRNTRFSKGRDKKGQHVRSEGEAKQLPRLKATPGGRTLLVAATLGVALMAGTGVAVHHLNNDSTASQHSSLTEGNAQPVRSCAVQSDAQIPPCAQDPTVLLTELVRLSKARDEALNKADSEALARLYAGESEQLLLDLALLERLADLGLSLEGVQTSLEQLEVTARSYPDVVVIGGDSFHSSYSYQFVDNQQTVHRAKAGAGEQVLFELRYEDQSWRISRVLQRENKSGTVANDDPTSTAGISSRG